jgi:hypothetical protein
VCFGFGHFFVLATIIAVAVSFRLTRAFLWSDNSRSTIDEHHIGLQSLSCRLSPLIVYLADPPARPPFVVLDDVRT